jgi:hypothetical protein
MLSYILQAQSYLPDVPKQQTNNQFKLAQAFPPWVLVTQHCMPKLQRSQHWNTTPPVPAPSPAILDGLVPYGFAVAQPQ